MLGAGYPLSTVTEALCDRWKPGVRLSPCRTTASDPCRRRVGRRAQGDPLPGVLGAAARLRAGRGGGTGRRRAGEARPGVLEAIAEADVILFPPSNPVVSVGTILAVPGIREAIADAGVPVVGLSPIVGDAPVRGMADKVLAAVGVESTAAAVAEHYGWGCWTAGSWTGGRGRRGPCGAGHPLPRGAADDDRPRVDGPDGREALALRRRCGRRERNTRLPGLGPARAARGTSRGRPRQADRGLRTRSRRRGRPARHVEDRVQGRGTRRARGTTARPPRRRRGRCASWPGAGRCGSWRTARGS